MLSLQSATNAAGKAEARVDQLQAELSAFLAAVEAKGKMLVEVLAQVW